MLKEKPETQIELFERLQDARLACDVKNTLKISAMIIAYAAQFEDTSQILRTSPYRRGIYLPSRRR